MTFSLRTKKIFTAKALPLLFSLMAHTVTANASQLTLDPMGHTGGYWLKSGTAAIGSMVVNCPQAKVGIMRQSGSGVETTQIQFDPTTGAVTSLKNGDMNGHKAKDGGNPLSINASTNLNQVCAYGTPKAPEQIVSGFLAQFNL